MAENFDNSRFPLTVIVLTYNEEDNIGPCIQSVKWADDVVVLDSGSTDSTISSAEAARPDVRVYENPFVDFGHQRNWALDNTEPRHKWILFLDADERCNELCAQAIQESVTDARSNVGFFLCYRNYFLGRWIKRSTLYPSWQLRLLKKGFVRFRREGHGQREVAEGPLGYVDAPYDHFGFSKGLHNWIARHNDYSTDEVELICRLRGERLHTGELLSRSSVVRRRCLKRLAAKVGFRPILRFLYLYVWRRGFLDGRAGLTFCLLRMAQEIHIAAKLSESIAQGDVRQRRRGRDSPMASDKSREVCRDVEA